MPRAAASGAGSDVPSSGPHSSPAPIPTPNHAVPRSFTKRKVRGGFAQTETRFRAGECAPVLTCPFCVPHLPRICRGLTALGKRISRSHGLCLYKTGTEVVTGLFLCFLSSIPHSQESLILNPYRPEKAAVSLVPAPCGSRGQLPCALRVTLHFTAPCFT